MNIDNNLKVKIISTFVFVLFIILIGYLFMLNRDKVTRFIDTNMVVDSDFNNKGGIDLNIADSAMIAETKLRAISHTALTNIQAKEYDNLQELVHPSYGLRFSPYGNLTKKDIVIDKENVSDFFKDSSIKSWGNYDGTSEKIELTPDEYYQKFIIDKDFSKAKKVSFNKKLGEGNTINNINDFYRNALFIEYHFPGFEPQYMGMDWVSLRLVFAPGNGEWYLVAIVHDEWTS